MEMNEVIDIFFLVSGIYLIYAAFMAKRKGTIADSVMLAKDITESDIRDKAGYVAYMSRQIIIVGILVVLSSALNFINDRSLSSVALNLVGLAGFLAAVVIYTVAYKKGRKQYID
jgi:hypothetical protein